MRAHNGSITCEACPVKQRSDWRVLDQADVHCLQEGRRPHVYCRHETPFHQGDECSGVYCIESGYILLQQTDSLGKNTVFAVFGPGQIMGYYSFFSGRPHAATARALTDCRICFVPAAVVETLLARSPELARQMLKTLATDPGPRRGVYLRDPRLPVRTRLVNLLLLLYEDRFFDVGGNGHVVFHLPMSREALADMIGARPETVARAIGELGDAGVALFEGRRVTVQVFRNLRDLGVMAETG